MDLVTSQAFLAAVAGSSATAVGAAVLWNAKERARVARVAARRASRRTQRILRAAVAEAEQLLREVELTPAGVRAVTRPAIAGQRLPTGDRAIAQGRAVVLVPELARPTELPPAAVPAAADPPGWQGWGYVDREFDHLYEETHAWRIVGGQPE
jgi:hypothetical protein